MSRTVFRSGERDFVVDIDDESSGKAVSASRELYLVDVHCPSVDATGIDGRYDMTINFSPPSAFSNLGTPDAGGDAVASEPNGAISIFEALSKQLGLRLESREVPAPVLVIDHVNEMPTEN